MKNESKKKKTKEKKVEHSVKMEEKEVSPMKEEATTGTDSKKSTAASEEFKTNAPQETRTITYEQIKKNKEINDYINMGNRVLGVLGYTDHSQAHAAVVSARAAEILEMLGYDAHTIELVKIAGFMHDIGNSVNRKDHAHTGAIMAFEILKGIQMPPEDIALIISAIGNHDESSGTAVHPISAALILADKTDVRRNRVRNTEISTFDQHDRVNYAVLSTELTTNLEKKVLHFDITLDETSCSMLDYFEIFLERMLMCRRAAELLGLRFKFTVNGNKVL